MTPNGSQVTWAWGSECDFEMGVCALRAPKSDLSSPHSLTPTWAAIDATQQKKYVKLLFWEKISLCSKG